MLFRGLPYNMAGSRTFLTSVCLSFSVNNCRPQNIFKTRKCWLTLSLQCQSSRPKPVKMKSCAACSGPVAPHALNTAKTTTWHLTPKMLFKRLLYPRSSETAWPGRFKDTVWWAQFAPASMSIVASKTCKNREFCIFSRSRSTSRLKHSKNHDLAPKMHRKQLPPEQLNSMAGHGFLSLLQLECQSSRPKPIKIESFHLSRSRSSSLNTGKTTTWHPKCSSSGYLQSSETAWRGRNWLRARSGVKFAQLIGWKLTGFRHSKHWQIDSFFLNLWVTKATSVCWVFVVWVVLVCACSMLFSSVLWLTG